MISEMKLRNKVTTVNIISVLLIILILGMFISWFSFSSMKENLKKELSYNSSLFATNFNEGFEKKQVLVNSVESIISKSFDITRLSEDGYIRKYKEYIGPLIQKYAGIFGDCYIFFNPELQNEAHDIWYVDFDMDGIVDRIPEVGLDYYDGDIKNKGWYYKPVLTQKAVWIEPYHSTIIDDISFVSYTKPVFIKNELIGVIGTDFVLDAILDKFDEVEVDEFLNLAILNEEGEFLIHSSMSDQVDIKEEFIDELPGVFNKIRYRDKGSIEYKNSEGEKMILSYNRLISGWYFLAYIPERTIYSDILGFMRKIVLIFILLAIMAIIIVSIISKGVSKPIEKLAEYVSEIEDPSIDKGIIKELLEYEDEIGMLTRAVNKMQYDLKVAYYSIEHHNVELDTKILERTEELTAINEELIATLEDLENTREELIEKKSIKSLDSMITGISHRLGSPIGNTMVSISTMSKNISNINELLESNTLSKSKFITFIDQLEELSIASKRNMKKARNLLESLVDIEKGFLENDIQKFNINDTLLFVVEILDDILVEEKVKVNFVPEETMFIRGYSKIYYILFMNFIKFSIYQNFKDKNGGNIFVKISKQNDTLKIKYWDDGNKISLSEIETLFDPFSISKFTQNMTGFELYQNYQLISRFMKGQIKYNEREDTFVVTIELQK